MPDFVPTPGADVSLTTGYRSTDQHLALDVKVDISSMIYKVMPEATPFITMLGSAEAPKKVQTVHNYVHNWLQKGAYPNTVRVAAAATAGATSITLDTNHGNRLGDNMVVRCRRTGETIYVITATASAISSCVRAVGDDSGVALLEGDELVLQAPSYPDASRMGTARSVVETSASNYLQIMRWPVQFSGRDIETAFYSGDDMENETRHNVITYMMLVERAFIFGKPYERTNANGKIQSFMGGLRHFITQNEWDLGNTEPTERAFVEFLEYAMRYGKGGRWYGRGVKYLYCPAVLMTIIEFWAKNRLQVLPEFKEKLGLTVKEYESTQGKVRLINDPILDPEGMAFLVDMDHVNTLQFANRGYKIVRNREDNDMDGKALELFADLGLKSEGVGDGEPHAVIYGESLKSAA